MKNIKSYSELFEATNNNEDKLEKFLSTFPDDAKSWAQATQTLSDMYHWMTENYNEWTETETLKSVGMKTIKTPSEWNTKYKNAIREAIKIFDAEQKKKFYKQFKSLIK